MENITSFFPEEEAKRVPGVYLITHEKTNDFYVGSSGDLQQRRRGHLSDLRRGCNKNKRLQHLYNSDENLKFLFKATSNREEAYKTEQELLDKFANSQHMLNTARHAKAAGLGLVRSEETRQKISQAGLGRIPPNKGVGMNEEYHSNFLRSREPLCKKVNVDGQEFVSLAEAARQLNLTIGCLHKRINSSNPSFSNYNYVI